MLKKTPSAQGYTDLNPTYAKLYRCKGNTVLIMGNCIKQDASGTAWVWTADWDSGKRINALVADLSEDDQLQPNLLQVVDRVRQWAGAGNTDALWWLGDFYEFGSRVTGAHGGKALAYYLAAIRREPTAYSQSTVARVLQDGANLFVARHPNKVLDRTPVDPSPVLAHFREYRDYLRTGAIYYPDTNDWEACVRLADDL